MKKLTTQAVKLVSDNGILFGTIAQELEISPRYLSRLLAENTDDRLVSEGVLELIKNHLAGMQEMQLIESAAQVAA